MFIFFYALMKFVCLTRARDLQPTPKTLNEGLEISYTMPNLFVLSLSQREKFTLFPLVGQRIDWKFPQLHCSPQKLCQSTLSLFELTQHNVSQRTEILWHWHCLVEKRRANMVVQSCACYFFPSLSRKILVDTS